jgi:tetratricopeptide (TPR) repeat protein
MFRISLLSVLLLGGLASPAQAEGFTLVGQVTTDKEAAAIRLVLEDPKAKNAEVGAADVGEDGGFEFRGLTGRSYRLVATIDGKKQGKRDVEILCRPGAIVLKDFHYGKSEPTLMLYFPSEDPEVLDVSEIQSNYPRDVMREYDGAAEDYRDGNLSRAVRRLEALIERAPDFYKAHSRLGLAFQDSGCFFDAEAEYVRASELSRRSVQPLLNLASAQIRAAEVPGQRDALLARALATLEKAAELRPRSALIYSLTGAALAKKESFEEAEKNYLRALELQDSFGTARLLLANLYVRQRHWDSAINQFRKYLEDDPFAPNRSIVKTMLAEAEKHR